MKKALFLLLCGMAVHSLSAQKRVVILGSSTAEGTGPKSEDSTWVHMFSERVGARYQATVVNLAKGGYTSYQIMPSDFVSPVGKLTPDTARNITKALSLGADMIIINMPTNDLAKGYSPAEYLENLRYINKVAQEHHVICFVATPQPRTKLTKEKRMELVSLPDSIRRDYPKYYIDFWTGLAAEDGKILPQYDCGDGIHLNGKGHLLLIKSVFKALNKRKIYK